MSQRSDFLGQSGDFVLGGSEYYFSKRRPEEQDFSSLSMNKYLFVKETAESAWKLYFITVVNAKKVLEERPISPDLAKKLNLTIDELSDSEEKRKEIDESLTQMKFEVALDKNIDEWILTLENFQRDMKQFYESVDSNPTTAKLLLPYQTLQKGLSDNKNISALINELKSSPDLPSKTHTLGRLVDQMLSSKEFQDFWVAYAQATINNDTMLEVLKNNDSYWHNIEKAANYIVKLSQKGPQFKDISRNLGDPDKSNNKMITKLVDAHTRASLIQFSVKWEALLDHANSPLEAKKDPANAYLVISALPAIHKPHNDLTMGSASDESKPELLNEFLNRALVGQASPVEMKELRSQFYKLYTDAYLNDRWKEGKHTQKGNLLKALEGYIISIEKKIQGKKSPGVFFSTQTELEDFIKDKKPNREELVFGKMSQFEDSEEVMESLLESVETNLKNLEYSLTHIPSESSKVASALYVNTYAKSPKQEKAMVLINHFENTLINAYKVLDRMERNRSKAQGSYKEQWQQMTLASPFAQQFKELHDSIKFLKRESFSFSKEYHKLKEESLREAVSAINWTPKIQANKIRTSSPTNTEPSSPESSDRPSSPSSDSPHGK